MTNRTIREDRNFRPGHTAIDIDADIGEPVYASETGVVVWAGYTTWGGGNMIVLAHGDTWQTYYAHLSESYLSCGQSIGRGSLIGRSGRTGAASWPYLHFEVRHYGFSYNPLTWLP